MKWTNAMRESSSSASGCSFGRAMPGVISPDDHEPKFRNWNEPQRTQRGEPQANFFGLRREAKLVAKRPVVTVVLISHAAWDGEFAIEKRCRRCALPPQSKIFARCEDSDRLHYRESQAPRPGVRKYAQAA